jgi:hypothetical protein
MAADYGDALNRQSQSIEVKTRTAIDKAQAKSDAQAILNQSKITGKSFEGRVGESDHLTRRETGTLDTNSISHLKGQKGELRGEHRKRSGKEWEDFKADIKKNGVKEPIFITKDYNQEAVISEGNHRLDAAIEVGLKEVPVEINYFGKAEDQGPAYLMGN